MMLYTICATEVQFSLYRCTGKERVLNQLKKLVCGEQGGYGLL